MKKRRHPPALTNEDLKLWHRVTRHVRPLKPETEAGGDDDATSLSNTVDTGKQPATAPPSGRVPSPAPPAVTMRSAPLAPVDQRLVRRVGRGHARVDAVLDLHGLTQQQAYPKLLAFLKESHALGRRLVLVVTGKGRIDEAEDWWEEGRRGVLRLAVPEWLKSQDFRSLIVGYQQAHARKGGAGAIYVQLRRRTGAGRP
jgi:DNA-nicking Smr family endonuclease